jgi:hypothetical protein
VAVDQLSATKGDVWTSTNGGTSWTNISTSQPAASGPWVAVASNASGSHLVALGGGSVWTN